MVYNALWHHRHLWPNHSDVHEFTAPMTHPNDEQGLMQCEFTTSMAQHAVVVHSDHGLTKMTCVVCNAL